jgi:hypothetical protein
MAKSYEIEQLEESINDVVNYFYRNNKKFYATAIQNAQSRVRLFESGGHPYREYNHRVNKGLCEALFYMNSDPSCDADGIRLVRKLIESYRDMNGLSTVDFATDCGEDKVINVVDGKFTDFVKSNDKHKFILLNTEVDEEYNVEDLVDALYGEFYSDVTHPDKVAIANEEIMRVIQQMIQQGHFSELIDGSLSSGTTQIEPLAVIRIK